MKINTHKAKEMFQSIKEKLDDAVTQILAMENFSDIFIKENGKPIYTLSSVTPKTQKEKLVSYLLRAFQEIELKENIPLEIPKRSDGSISKAPWKWKPFQQKHPFITAWLEIEVNENIEKFSFLSINRIVPQESFSATIFSQTFV